MLCYIVLCSPGYLPVPPGELQAPDLQQRVRVPLVGRGDRLVSGPLLHALHPRQRALQAVQSQGHLQTGTTTTTTTAVLLHTTVLLHTVHTITVVLHILQSVQSHGHLQTGTTTTTTTTTTVVLHTTTVVLHSTSCSESV